MIFHVCQCLTSTALTFITEANECQKEIWLPTELHSEEKFQSLRWRSYKMHFLFLLDFTWKHSALNPNALLNLKNGIYEYKEKMKMEVMHSFPVCLLGAFIYTSQLKFHHHVCVNSLTINRCLAQMRYITIA